MTRARLLSQLSGRSRSGRVGLVVILILAIVASIFARHASLRRQQNSLTAGSSNTSLSSMNSFAITLLLGGLRGPLVMFLWPSAENQKSDRNLEDFDTKIEWIRLLQAEFDTVHIFQIWNKAYNISVQMANVSNKYTTILDALDYAQKVDKERPNNINIIAAIGGIYFDKFGNSQERDYYKKQVRAQTLPHESRQKLKQDQPGWRRLELDPMLDTAGNILPAYLAPGSITLVDKKDPPRNDTYDGSELQYLKKYQPFPDGISPFALAYNYYKRSDLLQEAGAQVHAQLSELVIDSRPALALKNWAEDECLFARQNEITALGKVIPAEPEAIDNFSESIPLDQKFSGDKLSMIQTAIRSYQRVTQLAGDANIAYEEHTARYPTNLLLYREHRESVTALGALADGDQNYLQMLIETDPARKKQLGQAAADGYAKAISDYSIMLMRYGVPPERAPQLYPPGMSREQLEQLSPTDRAEIVKAIVRAFKSNEFQDAVEDAGPYLRAINRSTARLILLQEAR